MNKLPPLLSTLATIALFLHTACASPIHEWSPRSTSTDTAPNTKATPSAEEHLTPPEYLALEHLAQTTNLYFTNSELEEGTRSALRREKRSGVWGANQMGRRAFAETSLEERNSVFEAINGTFVASMKQQLATTCLDSTSNDTVISSLFYYGGIGTTVLLCPNSVVEITNAVFFTSPNQTLATQGYPTDDTRATLYVNNVNQSCAIYTARDWADHLAVRNIQIDGGRERLGIAPQNTGLALIEAGGNTAGQIFDQIHAYEPRGWSVLHGVEGWENWCHNMVVTNNQIGPSGHAPSGVSQFRRDTGTYPGGQWADGISMACKASTIQSNVVTDATDGAIVIFGSPGTQVISNTIVAVSRQLMGGINMVDWGPFAGSYLGVVVANNTLNAKSQFIKVGIPIGGMIWGTDNRTTSRGGYGTVTGNTFISGTKGYFGYTIGIAGHENVTVTENRAVRANYGSITSAACFEWLFHLPTPQAFTLDPTNTPGGIFQDRFTLATLALLICRGPGPILTRGSN